MATTERYAPNARTSGATDGTRASPSRSTGTAFNGTAGTATGKEAPSSILQTQGLSWALAARHLTPTTLQRLGVDFATERFRDKQNDRWIDSIAIRFHYANGAYKARAIPAKEFTASKGFKMRFWNLDAVLKGIAAGRVSRVYLFEGELDACAAVEAGISHEAVLSVPNGAKEKVAKSDSREDVAEMQRRYEWVDEALAEGLNQATAFVWAGDGDGPGLALRSDMVRIFGAAKFWFVDWPEGDKDANSVLINGAPGELLDFLVEGAKPWPIAGLFRLDDMPEPPPLQTWELGYAGVEFENMRLAPRCLSVATGHPGHGKTAFWTQTWFQVAERYDLTICCASFETHVKPQVRRQLRSLLSGKLEIDMQPDELRRADDWINQHYLFISPQDTEPTLKWLLNIAEVAIIRHGASILTVDPWNYLDGGHDPSKESETKYIGRCLRELRSFAKDLNCHVQILAHPAKMGGDRRGSAPVLEDISGSKNWDNAVDQGFAIHRPLMFDGAKRLTNAELHYLKSRFVEELGYPLTIPLDYKIDRARFEVGLPIVEEEGTSARRKG